MEDEYYLQWTHLLPANGYTVTQPATNGRLLVDAYAPDPPPPKPPEPGLVTGRVVSGAIFFDVDLDCWVLEDVQVVPIV